MTAQTFANRGSAENSQVISRTHFWLGYILSGFSTLFFLMDAVMKFLKPEMVVKTTVQVLGYPESEIVGIGIVLLACTLLYVFPVHPSLEQSC